MEQIKRLDKETQDLAWTSLPRAAREQFRISYKTLDRVVGPLLLDVFGHHNLTSDTEPEEMLMVERTSIINRYKGILAQQDPKNFGYSAYNQGQKDLLDKLFGDKCLPDKEPSVQVEPRFEVGQQVKIVKCTHPEYIDKVGIITSMDTCGNPYVKVEGLGSLKHAPFALEPYTEPSNVSDDNTKDDTKDNTDEIDEALYGKDIVSPKDEEEIEEMVNRGELYNALCELESASAKVRKALISLQ